VDPWNSTQLVTQLTGDGFTVATFGQGFKDMTSPSKEWEKLVISGKLRHGGNPVLRWMASNVAAEIDPAGNIKPSKKKSTERIDGIVAGIMGLGRALLRPKFIHKIVHYSAKKDIFVYLPTNGRLMKPEVIDRLGDAGIATVNLAVDSVKDRKSLPKALDPIRPYFEYLVKRQHHYGYTVMFNINICRNNMDDVRELTEIAHDAGIATDYHINETPMMEQDHFKHLDENVTYLTPDDWSKVDDLLDYLDDKRHNEGYKMVNQSKHMQEMKQLMRGAVPPWKCRAGQNSLIIRTDGTLAPCFPMYSATHDWGTIENPKFDNAQLDEMKKECSTHCLSTCNYILAYCYDTKRVLKWVAKQAMHGFKGSSDTIQ
jgi:MoaA/NifB/PqqE/SkfB family radical SAM enzyme